GDDTITGGAGKDALHGGAGSDRLMVVDGDAVAGETYDGGTGNDTLQVSGTADFTGSTITSIEKLKLGSSVTFTSDQLGAGIAADFEVTGTDTHEDTVTIRVQAGATGAALTVDLSLWTFAEWTVDPLTDRDRILIDASDVTNAAKATTLIGSTSWDIITGGAGDDTITAGAGVDVVRGGGGSDRIMAIAGDGNDVYDGGDGSDTVDYSQAGASVTIDLMPKDRSATVVSGEPGSFAALALEGGYADPATPFGLATGGNTGVDILVGIENAVGSAFADQIVGDDFANILDGGGGDDSIWGRSGNDTVYGGAGNDTLVGGIGSGTGSGNDTLVGGAGNDKLFGEDGNDTLRGGAGSDQYAAGPGNDVLYFEGDNTRDVAWGGTGRDRFVFQGKFGRDVIKDFLAVGPQSDKIDLRAYDTSYAKLHIAQVGSDVHITGLGPGKVIILEVVNAGAVTRDDFFF
ncbi:MAG TPA: calcium-binding protein, partial [Bauldia sp.]|nr:calcium-binding protein [Bauldia sp.]